MNGWFNMNMNKKSKVVLGVDLGGTKIKVGKVEGINITATSSNLIPASENAETVLAVVKETIANLFTEEIEGIGIGIPSVLDRNKGIIYDVQNIPSWKEIHLKEILEREFKVPVFIDNDANCFAIGEKLYGKGIDYENFVGVTLGTGIGTGIINKGTLLSDANCGSGEFGMIPYLDGIVEDYSSGQFFKNKIKIDGGLLFERAKKGDEYALNIYSQFGVHLGNAVKIILYSVDPGHIVFGGSIAAAKEFYEDAMYEELKSYAYPMSIKDLTIEYSELAGDSPILGAAAVYLDAVKNR
jgi:glucokinase